MSDALNFPLSDSSERGNIPGDLLGESPPQQEDSAAADPKAPNKQQEKQPAADFISAAAAQAARALGSGSSVHACARNAAPSPDRRRRRRALISAPVRVRGFHVTESGPDEISTTIDVSRGGILFVTQNKSFERGMDVAVTFPYSKSSGVPNAEQHGKVVRVHQMPDDRFAVAIAIGAGVGEDLVDSCGRKLDYNEQCACDRPEQGSTRPLVLAVDADESTRESLRNFLTTEGYDVIAVKNAPQAREVLDQFIPALLIAEVEGEGLPGFDLCAFVKSTHKLRKIPVVLTTRNGYPTDYSNAHSLGAVVCMAKPYRQDRLGHVVRLLAPPPQALAQNAGAPRPPDPSRRTFNGNRSKPACSNNGSRWFRFPSFH
jgi:twitching motility two-component system response regulator PilH